MRIKKIRWFISVGVFVLVVPVIVIRGLPVPGMGMQYGVLETQYKFAPAPEPTEEEKGVLETQYEFAPASEPAEEEKGVLETQYEFAPAPEPTEEEKRQNHFEQFSREYKRRMNQSP